VTDIEVRDSEGELTVEPWEKDGAVVGKRLTVERGSVVGWLLLRLSNLEQAVQSQQGLLHAAGIEVQRMRQEVAKARGGLVVPGRE